MPAVDKHMHLLGCNVDRIHSYLRNEIDFDEISFCGSVLVVVHLSVCLSSFIKSRSY